MLWFSINYICYGLWVFRIPTQIQLIVDHFSKTFCRVVQTILLMPKGQLLTKKKTHRAELTTVHSLTVHFTYTHFRSFQTTQNWSLKFIQAWLSHCDLYSKQILRRWHCLHLRLSRGFWIVPKPCFYVGVAKNATYLSKNLKYSVSKFVIQMPYKRQIHETF